MVHHPPKTISTARSLVLYILRTRPILAVYLAAHPPTCTIRAVQMTVSSRLGQSQVTDAQTGGLQGSKLQLGAVGSVAMSHVENLTWEGLREFRRPGAPRSPNNIRSGLVPSTSSCPAASCQSTVLAVSEACRAKTMGCAHSSNVQARVKRGLAITTTRGASPEGRNSSRLGLAPFVHFCSWRSVGSALLVWLCSRTACRTLRC